MCASVPEKVLRSNQNYPVPRSVLHMTVFNLVSQPAARARFVFLIRVTEGA